MEKVNMEKPEIERKIISISAEAHASLVGARLKFKFRPSLFQLASIAIEKGLKEIENEVV